MRLSRSNLAALSAAAFILTLVTAPASLAAKSGARTLDMDIGRHAVLSQDGQQATLRVKARCPVGAQLLESFVYVNQDGFSTEWGHVRVPCDGRRHTRTVTVTTLDFSLHEGSATASGFMSTTGGDSISPVRELTVRRAR